MLPPTGRVSLERPANELGAWVRLEAKSPTTEADLIRQTRWVPALPDRWMWPTVEFLLGFLVASFES